MFLSASGGATSTQYPDEASFDLGILQDDSGSEADHEPVRSPKLQKEVCSLPAKSTIGGVDVEEVSRFKTPTTDEIIDQLSSKTFAQNTQRKVQWAVGLFDSVASASLETTDV